MYHLYAHKPATTRHKSAGGISLPSGEVITIWNLRQYPPLFYFNTTLPAHTRLHLKHTHTHTFLVIFSSSFPRPTAACVFYLSFLPPFTSLCFPTPLPPHRSIQSVRMWRPSPTRIDSGHMASESAHNEISGGKRSGIKRW